MEILSSVRTSVLLIIPLEEKPVVSSIKMCESCVLTEIQDTITDEIADQEAFGF